MTKQTNGQPVGPPQRPSEFLPPVVRSLVWSETFPACPPPPVIPSILKINNFTCYYFYLLNRPMAHVGRDPQEVA